MSDLMVLIVAAVLALGVPILGVVTIWRIARRPVARHRALTLVLGVCAGMVLLGVILPPTLMAFALDPFVVWVPYALLAVACAAVLGWRWPVLPEGRGGPASVLVSAGVLLAVMIMAGAAVT